MSVVIETTLGDITVDLFLAERPRACLNFLKLCKIKYYNYNLFHTISRGFIAQTGDPTGSRSGGESVYGVLDGTLKRYFEGENEPRIKHTKMGLISFVGNEDRMIASQFFLTLGDDLTYLDEKHCVFGEVVEGFDILEVINEVICDKDDRPYQDVRITHTVVLDDPFPNPKRLLVPSRSPSPSAERLQGGRIAPDEEIDEMEGKSQQEIAEMQAEREARARATILEMVGDLPDADMAPPENVLFVCKLNPVTSDDDLEIIFSRFGKIKSCEVIRDKKTGDSLQYAFVEFEEQKSCEDAYFKMDNVLIDDRRIHVDFSQSVSKIKWHGKGRGVTHYDEAGRRKSRGNNDIGKGNYRHKANDSSQKSDHSRRDVAALPQRTGRNDRDRNKTSPKRSKNRDQSLSPAENHRGRRDRSASPPRSRNKVHRDGSPERRRRDGAPSASSKTDVVNYRKNKVRSVSPKRTTDSSKSDRKYRDYSPSPRRNRDNSSTARSSKRAEDDSRGSRNNGSSRRSRDKSSPRRYRDKSPKRNDSSGRFRDNSASLQSTRRSEDKRRSIERVRDDIKDNGSSRDRYNGRNPIRSEQHYKTSQPGSSEKRKLSRETLKSTETVTRKKSRKDLESSSSDSEYETKKRKSKKAKKSDGGGKIAKKKKRHSSTSSSVSSDSEEEKKVVKKKKMKNKKKHSSTSSSASSSSEEEKRTKNKKKNTVKKSKKDLSSSDSDSDEEDFRKKKSKKKKKKYKSDSD